MARGYRIEQHAGVDPATGLTEIRLDLFDIVRNSDNKVMNPTPLRLRAANRMFGGLSPINQISEQIEETVMADETNQSRKIRWRKIGGGSFHMKNRIIKPNQVFEAYPEDIPEAFRDCVKPLEELPVPVEEKPIEVVSNQYSVKSRGPGWYDVVDSNGKRVNENALRQPEAQALLESLN